MKKNIVIILVVIITFVFSIIIRNLYKENCKKQGGTYISGINIMCIHNNKGVEYK